MANDGPHVPIILYNNLWLHVQDASYTRGRLMGLANTRRMLPDVIIFGEYKVMLRPVRAHFYTYQYSKQTIQEQAAETIQNSEALVFHPELRKSSFVRLITKLLNPGAQHN